jgi:hypothetical protein
MGCHIDGFIAVAAHTHIVEEEEAPITGKVSTCRPVFPNYSQIAVLLRSLISACGCSDGDLERFSSCFCNDETWHKE